jgi:hypothetical protein
MVDRRTVILLLMAELRAGEALLSAKHCSSSATGEAELAARPSMGFSKGGKETAGNMLKASERTGKKRKQARNMRKCT